jgi:HEAT repeat protein
MRQSGGTDAETRLNRAAALCAVTAAVPARLLSSAAGRLEASICGLAADTRAEVRNFAVRCVGLLLVHELAAGSAQPKFVEVLAQAVRDESSDVRRRALFVLKQLAKTSSADALATHLAVLLPPAADALNDRVSPVKLVAERAVRRCCWPPGAAPGVESASALVSAAGGPPLRAKLTDAVLRRLSKLPDDSEDEDNQ